MLEYISENLNSPLLLILTVIYFIISSITTFGIRITQAKKNGTWDNSEPDLPRWTDSFYVLETIILIIILILNWHLGIAVYVLKFILKVLPVLETIGNILMRPFRNN